MKFNSNIHKHINDKSLTTQNLRWVKPVTLLTPRRLDLVAKYLLAKDLLLDKVSDYRLELYFSHLNIINGFVESDSTGKVGRNLFFKAFSGLAQSLAQEGYYSEEPIPVNFNEALLDGAHRTALSIALDIEVPIINVDVEGHCYDYKFWHQRGLKDNDLEYLIKEYVSLKPNSQIAILWPSSENNVHELTNLLASRSDVIFEKDLELSRNGKINLIRALYSDEKWLGSQKNHFSGAQQKSDLCFSCKGNARVIVFEYDGNVNSLKDTLRRCQGLGKHALHISENVAELKKMSRIVLNSNSMHWINFAKLTDNKWLHTLLSDYNKLFLEEGTDDSKYCLAGSSVLAAYGLRANRDIDYLTTNDELTFQFDNKNEIGVCNSEYEKFGYTVADTIENPGNYFYYNGFKMESLSSLKNFKLTRGELKDLDDVELIENILNKRNHHLNLIKTIRRCFSPYFLKGRIKFFLFRLRYYFFKIKIIFNNHKGR